MSKYSKEAISQKVKDNPFPVMTKDPIEKEKDAYGLQIGKHIYFKGLQEDMSSDRRATALENRAYGSNRQDISKYKGLIDKDIDKPGNLSYINIDWTIATPGKKFTDIIVGDMINQDYKIQFNAIDKYSKAKIKKDRDEYYGKIARDEDMRQMEAEAGIVLEKRSDFQPKNKEEVDLYMEMEYKQAVEIGMETVVDFELYNNDWDKLTKKRVIRDLVENNKGAARLYFDRNNQIRIKYVDAPVNLYTSATSYSDYRDTEYEAERDLLSIRSLKSRDTKGTMTEAQWFKVAQLAANRNNNPAWRFGADYNNSNYYNESEYAYDDFRIEVLDFVFYTEDKYIWEERDDSRGRRHMKKKTVGYQKPKRSDKNIEVTEKDIEMSYEGIWIVNTEFVVGYGRSKNILRPYSKKDNKIAPKLLRRYVIFEPNLRNGTSSSMVDVMKPHLDQVQLLVLRKRHIIAEMTPTGVAVDVAGITDVMSLLNETDPMKIIKLYKQKGVLFFARTDVNGDPANGLPIQEINNPFAENLIALDNAILHEIQHIRDNTGINDARDGSAPDKNALVGIEKMRLMASNNVTRELYQGFFDGIFAQVGRVMARMIQYKFEYADGGDEYDNIIGEEGVNSIEFAKDIPMVQLGVKIEALPTDDQIQELLNMLDISLKSKEIRPEDYLEVKRIKNVKKAERLLIHRRKKYAEQQMAEFEQKEAITAEREKASAMGAAEAEKVKQMAKAEAEIMVAREELRLKKELDDHETQNEIKKIDKENYWKMQLLDKQLEEGDDSEGASFGVDMPRINQNPGGAIQRQSDVTP
jgi:hypothetical protein